MGLGPFPDISLARARELSVEYRALVRDGVDPIEHRNKTQVGRHTFGGCAEEYIESHKHGWSNAKHAAQWENTLEEYVLPRFGQLPVAVVSTEDVLSVLQPIWSSKTETAKRVQGRIENILDYAAARGFRDPVNPARWRGHLDKLLPRPSKVHKPRHHPAMPYGDVSAFLATLGKDQSMVSQALQFLILTATRTGEVVGAKWSEIDLENAVWTIPESRMKAGREHRVPLSDKALNLLKGLPRVSNNEFVFTGNRSGLGLSNMALLMKMKRMGYKKGGELGEYVPHGFRSSFRDWAGEISSFPRDVIEMALAHSIQDKAEAAYMRGDLFRKRAMLMQAWADYLGRQDAEVVQLESVKSKRRS
jgi:integrase